MFPSQLFIDKAFLCEVRVSRGARGTELVLQPGRQDLVPGDGREYQLRHRGRTFRVTVKENFSFGPETRLVIDIGEQEE